MSVEKVVCGCSATLVLLFAVPGCGSGSPSSSAQPATGSAPVAARKPRLGDPNYCVPHTGYCGESAKTYQIAFKTCRTSGPQGIAGKSDPSEAAVIFGRDFQQDFRSTAVDGCLAGFKAGPG